MNGDFNYGAVMICGTPKKVGGLTKLYTLLPILSVCGAEHSIVLIGTITNQLLVEEVISSRWIFIPDRV